MEQTQFGTPEKIDAKEYQFVQTRQTVNIGGRTFNVPMYDNQSEVFLLALTKAFNEIDELKEQNSKLNDKINSLRKSSKK